MTPESAVPLSLRDTVDALSVALESTTASFKRFNEASKRRPLPMVGDIVRPRDRTETLRFWPTSMFGAETAVVIRVKPFMVVVDSLTARAPREDFEVVGRADDETFAEDQKALTLGGTNRRVKRERAKVRRRNRRSVAAARSTIGQALTALSGAAPA